MQIPSRWETREKRPLCTRTAAKECCRPVAARFRNRAAARLRKNRVSLFLSLSRLGRRGFVVEKVWTMHTAEENDDYPVLEPDG